jgi:hypothetical protein
LVPDLLEGVFGLFAVELCLQDLVFDGVVAGGSDVGDCSTALGRQHDLVFDHVVLLNQTVNVSSAHVGTDLEFRRMDRGCVNKF